MSALKILIVEDEPIIAKDLSYMLQDIGYQITGIKYSATEALSSIEKEKPDLIMLDINIEGDIDGVQLAKTLNKSFQIPFIFLTSYSDESTLTRAKITHPLGYLIKPIDEKDLISTIEIAMHNFNTRVSEFSTDIKPPNVIYIRDANHHNKVYINDIIYAEAQDNYTFIHTSGKKYLISSTLKLVENKLEPFGFKRIHRSYLINPKYITKLEDGYIHLPTKALPIGKTYKKSFFGDINIL